MWATERAADLNRRASSLLSGEPVPYTFIPSQRLVRAYKRGYIPEEARLGGELAAFAPEPFVYVGAVEAAACRVVIVTNHGADEEADALWELRKQLGDEVIIAIWLWDNHAAHIGNLKAVLAADFVFPSHAYVADYLHTPASLVSQHIPLCAAQWTRAEAEAFFNESAVAARRHKLLVNYVMQAIASPLRRRVLEEYREGLAEADVFLMNQETRSRYFDLSPQDRFRDWASYKGTIIVPMGHDLSTRVFDALLAGLVPVVPEGIDDFEQVISREVQESLGIVRVDSLELPAVREGAQKALAVFDAMGEAGARARHAYVLENHLLPNRITEMLYMIWLVASGQLTIEFGTGHAGAALYQRPRK